MFWEKDKDGYRRCHSGFSLRVEACPENGGWWLWYVGTASAGRALTKQDAKICALAVAEFRATSMRLGTASSCSARSPAAEK